MALFGSRGALRTALAVAALAASGLIAYALWPGTGGTGSAVHAGSPPASVGGSPVGPLALTPPVTGAPQAEAPPTTAAPPPTAPPTTAAPNTSATEPATAAAAACATLATSSTAVLPPGCYVEVALNHLDIAWPGGTGASTSSETLARGEVWDGLSTQASATASGLVVGVTLANHSTQTMRFPAGLVVPVTVAAPGVPPLQVALAEPSVISLAPGASLQLSGPVTLTAPATYGLAASVEFQIG